MADRLTAGPIGPVTKEVSPYAANVDAWLLGNGMSRTLTEEIYERMRDDIMMLRMKPGEKVSEAKLARLYGVSRAPIRNVIQKLQEEELVIVKPQAGTIIMPISLKRAKDILDVRAQLETYAAGVAAEKISDEDLTDLEQRFSELEDTGTTEGQAAALFAVDSYLHETIWNICGNQEVIRILGAYRDAVRRIRRATLDLGNRRVSSIHEMRAILAALTERNPEKARAAMYAHITNISRSIERVISNGGGT